MTIQAQLGRRLARHASNASGSDVLPIVEEQVQVDRLRVDRGGYRLTKRVVAEEAVIDEALTSQRVEVERRAVGRLLTSLEPPPSRQEGDTLVIPVVEEVLVTERRLMLKEEIRITRVDAVIRRPQTVTVRREEVSIERLEPEQDLGSS